MKRLVIMLAAALALAAPIDSTAFRQADSPLSGARLFTLGNGLTVIAREERSAPLIAIDLWIRAGSAYERPEEAGAAHFLEHMIFKGTATRGPGEIDAVFEDIGSQLNAGTTRDAVHFHATIAANYLSSSLAVLADMVQNASLEALEFERERAVIRDEAATRSNDWRRVVSDSHFSAAFRSGAIGRPIIGSTESLARINREAVHAFYRRRYQPGTATLVLAGEIDAAVARRAAASAFDSWPAAPPDSDTPVAVPSESARIALMRDLPDCIGSVAVPLSPFTQEIANCAAVVAAILGDPRDGRIADSIRKSDRSAEVVAESDPGKFGGLLMISVKSLTSTSAKIEKTLVSELDRIVKDGFTETEVDWARRRLIGSFLFETETLAGQTRILGSRHLEAGYLSGVNYMQALGNLSAEAVNSFIRSTLAPERRIILTSTSTP